MIHINPCEIKIEPSRASIMAKLTKDLLAKPTSERSAFIDSGRNASWGHREQVVKPLIAVVGNKCWYSEVQIDGFDPNVDHFRPKGRACDVDDNLNPTGVESVGYWWLAFEPLNYRLASQHSNQWRSEGDTCGGKQDYFPVRGPRAPEKTSWGAINENYLALDPCSATDVALLWFDVDGKPSPAKLKNRHLSTHEILRVHVSIMLYHLNKKAISTSRTQHIIDLHKDLKAADAYYELWMGNASAPNLQAKSSFDLKIAEIKKNLGDRSLFAGAKRCAVRNAVKDYEWIEDSNLL